MQIKHFHSVRAPGHWLETVEDGAPERPLIFMVHGAAGSWRNFRYQLEHFRGDHRVVALDLRGHGQSPWVRDSSIHDFYSDVEELFLSLGDRPATVVAHSFGGYLATRLATTHPDLVSRLVLLNTAGNIPRTLSYQLLKLVTPLADFVARPDSPIAAGSAVCQELLGRILQDWDCWPMYAKVQCPALLMLGQMDPLIPVQLGRKAAEAMPACDLQVIPGGHVSMWEMPQRVNQSLRTWLKG